MEEYRDRIVKEEPETPSRTGGGSWLVLVAGTSIVATCLAIGYGYHQQTLVSQLTGQQEQMSATVGQLQGQIETLTGKLNEVTAAQQAAAAAAAQANTPAAKRAAGKRSGAESKRLKEIQARIEDQQKQLKDTQDEVAKTRSDLEGNLSATRDDLNGSIARTHEELVALAKRGERSYIEFNLTKAKQFQRYGPLMLSLRKADTKHKSFDLAMIVDDNQLSKKHVNLYEPILIHRTDDPQPVQVVINKIDRDRVQGYVSAPKYRNSELTPSLTPASQKVPAESPAPAALQTNPQEPPSQQPLS
jgi:outer membrane murein-binding lipoprotein Lpp